MEVKFMSWKYSNRTVKFLPTCSIMNRFERVFSVKHNPYSILHFAVCQQNLQWGLVRGSSTEECGWYSVLGSHLSVRHFSAHFDVMFSCYRCWNNSAVFPLQWITAHVLALNTARASVKGSSSVAHVVETCLHISPSTTALSVFILLNGTVQYVFLYTPAHFFVYRSSSLGD